MNRWDSSIAARLSEDEQRQVLADLVASGLLVDETSKEEDSQP